MFESFHHVHANQCVVHVYQLLLAFFSGFFSPFDANFQIWSHSLVYPRTCTEASRQSNHDFIMICNPIMIQNERYNQVFDPIVTAPLNMLLLLFYFFQTTQEANFHLQQSPSFDHPFANFLKSSNTVLSRQSRHIDDNGIMIIGNPKIVKMWSITSSFSRAV